MIEVTFYPPDQPFGSFLSLPDNLITKRMPLKPTLNDTKVQLN